MTDEEGNKLVTTTALWFNSLYQLSLEAEEAVKGWDYTASTVNNRILHKLISCSGYAKSAGGILKDNDIDIHSTVTSPDSNLTRSE